MGLWAPCGRHLIAKEASAPCDEAVAKVTTFFLLEKSQVNKHVNRLKSHVNCWWTYSGYLDDKVSLFQDLNFLWRVKNIICCDLRQLQLDFLSFRSIFSLFTLLFLAGCEGIPCSYGTWRTNSTSVSPGRLFREAVTWAHMHKKRRGWSSCPPTEFWGYLY